MTVAQLHDAFKIRLDKVDSLAYPNIVYQEIDFFLNLAQERIVKQRYGINNSKRAGFETIQKRTDDLRQLIVSANISPQATSVENKPNGLFYQLPNSPGIEYWFAIDEECDITYKDCDGNTETNRVPVKTITHDKYNKLVRDPFNNPYELELFRLMYQDKVEIIGTNSITPTTYYLRYIKKPRTIDYVNGVTSELADHIHNEIVAEAVNIALEDIESRRIQTQQNILNTEE